MVVIGINSSHVATACLLKDGKILACISEERLTKVKHQAGFPVLSIRECLRITGLSVDDVDFLALNFTDPKYHMQFSAFAGEKGRVLNHNQLSLLQKTLSLMWGIKEYILVNAPQTKYIFDRLLDIVYKLFVNGKLEQALLNNIEKELGIHRWKVVKVDHHTAHIYSAYHSSGFSETKPMLIFTLDSMGDGVCATVSIAEAGKIRRISTTPSGSSIGDIYTQTTAYLGMKIGEHEYKVMGLAPYANEKHYKSAYEKIKDLVWVNDDLTFETKVHSHMFYKLLPKIFAYERFDNVAAAVQVLTEERICQWIKMAITKTGIADIACAGGVFMNVKMNQRITGLKEVKNLFVMPSSSDESTAIGAAFWAYSEKGLENFVTPSVGRPYDLYLGGKFADKEIQAALGKKQFRNFKVVKPKDIETKAASLVSQGNIVARFAGRMEWGARALGNRSILAHPSHLQVLAEINHQIKSRDFWMPFAPSILEEDEKKYIVNDKHIAAPYMIITFDATEEGRDKLKAAMHQYDHTLRPQIVYKDWNSKYYKLIKEFKKLTGIGGILNTSFNLHGYPIVYTPEDALLVFKNSGLKYLALGPYLVSKEP